MTLLAVSVVRVPVAKGYFRPLFQLITETGVFLMFAIFIYCKINRWWGMFLALTIFSTVYPSFGKWTYMARGAVLVGCVWYTLLVLTVEDPKYLLDAICVIAVVNVLFATYQHCGFDPYKIATLGLMDSVSSHPTGLMGNMNLLSAILAFALPAFFRRWWHLLVPVIFYGLMIASSSGGAVAATVMVFIYFFLKHGREGWLKNFWKLVLLLVWFCHFTFYIDPPVVVEMEKDGQIVAVTIDKSRTDAWKKGMELYSKRPLAGYGIGHWKLIFRDMAKPNESVMVQAHNEYVQGLFEMGVFFVVIMIGYFIWIVRTYRREAILSATAVGIIAINSTVNFPFHVATTAIMAVTWMAVFQIQIGVEDGKREA